MALEPGAICYYHDAEKSWINGRVESWDGKVGSAKPTDGGKVSNKLSADDIFIIREDCINEDVPDLLHLTLLHDSTLLACLRVRYFKDLIYTNIGAIVVAINPFNFKIPYYMDDKMPEYLAEGDRIERNIPHSWAQAHNTYWEMVNNKGNQTILVSGESGAGKTEASKIVFKYLAAVCCKSGTTIQKEAGTSIGGRINKASPLLEAFGNAKTIRNDNSSRFGKFMRVKFSSDGFLVGAHITKYLLEKSRIVTAMPGERLYHSFYLLCRGQPHEFKDQDFLSLKSGNTTNNKDFDTPEEYSEVISSMTTIGLVDDHQQAIWNTLAGAMHLLNLKFDKDGEGSVISQSTLPSLSLCLKKWGIDDGENFKNELSTTAMDLMGQTIVKHLRVVQAVDGRDALCKALYDSLFSLLITQCNDMLDSDSDGTWIGLLDIFGFEDFDVNSFEQLCINLANETLQHHYNSYIFEKDMEECKSEGIDVTAVVFPDNTECLKMISARGGIISLLDNQCAIGSGTDELFLSSVEEQHSGNLFFAKKRLSKDSFIIHHYAGSVAYTVTGFLMKNRDTLKDAWKTQLRNSNCSFIKELLPAPTGPGTKMSAGGFFKSQLGDLMELINSTNPHWIRCVKPHPAKKPKMMSGIETMKQLASAGVLGTVKIRKAGYPVRIAFEEFRYRYAIILKSSSSNVDTSTHVTACSSLLKIASLSSTDAQVGSTRVFLKSDAYVKMESLKKEVLNKFSEIVQAYSRGLYALHAKVRPKIMAGSQDLLAKMRKSQKKLTDWKKKEATERLENIDEESKEWSELRSEYEYFVNTTVAEIIAAEKQRLWEESERLRIEEEERARIQADKDRRAAAIAKRKADRERMRSEQKQQEADLLAAVTQLKKDKLAAVEREVVEIKRKVKISEEAELKKAAAARKNHEHKMTITKEKSDAVRARRDQKQREDQLYQTELATETFEKEKWAELLTTRTHMTSEHKAFVKGIESSLRHSDGKARVKAQEQRFTRLTEVRQSEELKRDFLREIEKKRQHDEVIDRRRIDRIAKTDQHRQVKAFENKMKEAYYSFEQEQQSTRDEWSRLVDKEKRRKRERQFKEKSDLREEGKILKNVEVTIERSLALQNMEEKRNIERSRFQHNRSKSEGRRVGGTRTSDVVTKKVTSIDPFLHQRLMGSPKTASAGTLNDLACRAGLGDMQLGNENCRTSLHWSP